MHKFYGKDYYIDIYGIVEKCRTGGTISDEDGKDVIEINVFKYELIKMMLDRVLNEFDDEGKDDILSSLKDSACSLSFNFSFQSVKS